MKEIISSALIIEQLLILIAHSATSEEIHTETAIPILVEAATKHIAAIISTQDK